MNTKRWSILILCMSAVSANAQESTTDLSGSGMHSKFLTHNQLDRWLFEGEKGESVIAYVASREFDPVLELAREGAAEGKLLKEVDDPGGESRFALRLPETGKYEIRIHAFKFQGGGNYSLNVQRFQAEPLVVGKPLVGAFDREGKGRHFFAAAKDQILVPDVKGASSDGWRMLDPKGKQMRAWAGAVHIETEGECYLIMSGPPGRRYEVHVREARQRELTIDKALTGDLKQGEMDVWSFQGKPGMFRLLEVEKDGVMESRLLYAPPDRKSAPRLARPGDPPEITLLPVSSRGGRLRFAAVLGREGRYQLQLRARTPASYTLTARDPSQPIQLGVKIQGSLPVGGAGFYSFKTAPGRLLDAGLASERFVPVLRLYDRIGQQVNLSSDDDDRLEARVTHMVVDEGLYRLHVASLGNGGGGDFSLSLEETKLKELEVGGRGKSTLEPGGTEFWTFAGAEGKTVFLNARSATFSPAVSLRSPGGVVLAADAKGGAAGSLLALKLPATGRYTVWISSQRGAGEYTVRLIDGD